MVLYFYQNTFCFLNLIFPLFKVQNNTSLYNGYVSSFQYTEGECKKELVWHFFLTRLLKYNDKIFCNNKTTHLNIVHIANSKATFRVRNYIQIAHGSPDSHFLRLDSVNLDPDSDQGFRI
jgi:hypothetical protein